MSKEMFINQVSGGDGDIMEFHTPHGYLYCCRDAMPGLWRIHQVKAKEIKFLGYGRCMVLHPFKLYRSFLNNLKTKNK